MEHNISKNASNNILYWQKIPNFIGYRPRPQMGRDYAPDPTLSVLSTSSPPRLARASAFLPQSHIYAPLSPKPSRHGSCRPLFASVQCSIECLHRRWRRHVAVSAKDVAQTTPDQLIPRGLSSVIRAYVVYSFPSDAKQLRHHDIVLDVCCTPESRKVTAWLNWNAWHSGCAV